SCGTYVASLCPEPDGCYDPGMGDYDVSIPNEAASGSYKIRISLLSPPSPAPAATEHPVPTGVLTSTMGMGEGDGTGGSIFTDAASAEGLEGCTPDTFKVIAPTPSPTRPPVPVWPGVPYEPPTEECDQRVRVNVSLEYYSSTTTPLLTIFHESGKRLGGCTNLTALYQELLDEDGFPMARAAWCDATGGGAINSSAARPEDEAAGVWLLAGDLHVLNGITLQLWGGEGGDCQELRIRSTDSEFYNLRGHGGNLDIRDTKVFGWDDDLGGVRVHPNGTDGSDPRSYVSCISEVLDNMTCTSRAKKDKGECRMDILRSELGYLGYQESESYGLTWKVRGLCEDLSNVDIFDQVNVYGNILYSDIHHMWYGMYSYGHQGGDWSHNMMHDNWLYGFDPHDDSDYLTIHNNSVWNNGKHGIIASKRCDHVSIQGNRVWGGATTGIMLHRSSNYAVVKG
ncbi:unnamed protein product, partial [Discosporangium mesarthrocarpum]